MRIGEYETHPAADVFPLLEADDFDELVEDIREHGLREPIWRVWVEDEAAPQTRKPLILDGRNRLLACQQAGVKPDFRDYEGNESLAAFVISLNLKRRHLSKSQLAAAAVDMLPIFEAEARERMLAGRAADNPPATLREGCRRAGESAAQAAEQFGSSARSVQTAKSVREQDPELFDLIKSGRVEVGTADKALKSGSEVRDLFVDRVLVNEVPARLALRQAQDEVARRKGDPAMGLAQAMRASADDESAPMSHREGYDSDEWYTPEQYVEAAREVLGGIDLDPASCEVAQERIRAERYFTKDDDGLAQEWAGRVWLNPPYSQPLASQFGEKLVEELDSGRVTAAIMVQNASTDAGWFHLLAERATVCLTRGRINFDRADGVSSQNRYGQCFFYFGDDPDTFCKVFGAFGLVGALRSAA